MCTCADKADAALACMNTRISWVMMIRADGGAESRLQIATVKRDPRDPRKPFVVAATYCPFCGKNWEAGLRAAASREQYATGILRHYDELTFGTLASLPIER